jgi:hypothetical protein
MDRKSGLKLKKPSSVSEWMGEGRGEWLHGSSMGGGGFVALSLACCLADLSIAEKSIVVDIL